MLKPASQVRKSGQRVWHSLLALLLLWGTAQSGLTQSTEPRFIRYESTAEPWQGRLQTAIVSYTNAAGVELDLVAAVHIADPRYYAELNRYFQSRDQVLYELVAEPDQRPTPADRRGPVSVLGFLQQAAATFLDIGFQLRHIDYQAANFRHADLSPSQLQTLMAARNESFLTMFLDLALAQMANEQARRDSGDVAMSALNSAALMQALAAEDQASAIKSLLAQELAHADGLLLSPEQEAQTIILGERNRVALEVLEATLADPGNIRISIFYGAAHMPGLERIITAEMGFQRRSQRWLDAWRID